MQVPVLMTACRLSSKPTLKGIIRKPLQSATPPQPLVQTSSFHQLAESSLAIPAKMCMTGPTASALQGSRNFAKRTEEGDRFNPSLEGRPVLLDPAQACAYSEAKMMEMKKKLKLKGVMKDKDTPKKPPVM